MLGTAILSGGTMWFFAWILGVLLALAFRIINLTRYAWQQCLGSAKDERPAV